MEGCDGLFYAALGLHLFGDALGGGGSFVGQAVLDGFDELVDGQSFLWNRFWSSTGGGDHVTPERLAMGTVSG